MPKLNYNRDKLIKELDDEGQCALPTKEAALDLFEYCLWHRIPCALNWDPEDGFFIQQTGSRR